MVLVTGAAGFAGSHLLDALEQANEAPLVAWHRPDGTTGRPGSSRARWMAVDLLDRDGVRAAINDIRPATIYHCAGAAQVAGSWNHAREALEANVLGTHHLFEAIRCAGLSPRVLVTGSSTVYRPSAEAIAEGSPIAPASPYALSKLAQEMLALQVQAAEGLSVVVTRSFNHVGPRQSPAFVAASIARQLALIEAGRVPPRLEVGNIQVSRDLTDVRDTVRAYRAIMERGRPGSVYNVCSGRAYSIQELIHALVLRAGVRVEIREDPARLRRNDIPLVLGDNRKVHDEVGWQPEIPLERTLSDLFEYWREEVKRTPASDPASAR